MSELLMTPSIVSSSPVNLLRRDSCRLQLALCTVAVMSGPVIAILHHLIRLINPDVATVNLANIVRGLLCVMLFICTLLSGRLRLLIHPVVRPLLFLATYVVLTSFLSPFPYENLVFAAKLFFAALVFASSWYAAESEACSERWLMACAWFILLFMGICQGIGLMTGNTVGVYRSDYATAGVIEQPRVTAALIVCTLPVFLRFFPKSRTGLVGIMVVLISLFFTMRRSELVAVMLAILCVLVSVINPFRSAIVCRKGLLLLLLLCVLTVVGFRTEAGQDLLVRMRDLNPSEGTGSGRYEFWALSLSHIMDRSLTHQVLGEGVGSIRDFLGRRFGIFIGSHNDLLDFTYAFGIFGLMAICWWYFGLMRFSAYVRSLKSDVYQGVLSAFILLSLISLGTGGFCEPSFALLYAALGFWAGQISYRNQSHHARRASYRTNQF